MYPVIIKKPISGWKTSNIKLSDKLIGYVGSYEGKWMKHPYLRDKNLTRILIDGKYQGKGYGSEIYTSFIKWFGKRLYAMIS